MRAALKTARPMEATGAERDGWTSVATHSHMLRSHKVDFEAAKRNLVAWAREFRAGAVGLGSPWEPVSAARYGECERGDRDRYFGGFIPPESVMDREAIQSLLDDLNARAAGGTLFYLDNETPKNRFGHLWYVGFEYQVPAWHDYSQDRRVQFWDGDACEDRNALTGGYHRRRTYAEVVARQRLAGALAIWAHPTSWWRSGGDFVTNIAAELVTHLHADGFLDGMVVQGYDACHRAYQALWFDLLDRGVCVPAFAELDACFDELPIASKGCFLNYVAAGRPNPTVSDLVREFRDGRHFVSSGPHLALEVDGQPMGSHVASGPDRTHRAVLTAWPAPGQACLSRVELLGRGGTVLAAVERFAGGAIEFELQGVAAGYVVGRAFGEGDTPGEPRQQSIRHCALTNPVYLGPARPPRRPPAVTALTLVTAAGSPARGGPFRVLNAGGEELERGTVRDAQLALQVPATARVEVAAGNGATRDIPVAMANRRLRRHIDYLADGLFLRDWPQLAPGDVPVEAFRFEAVRQALDELSLEL